MEIRKEFIDKMLDCPWLQSCGNKDKLELDVEYLNSWKEAEKKISYSKWENLCIDRHGDLTVFLCLNHGEEYNKYWNEKVGIIKENYISIIEDKINPILLGNILSNKILNNMKWNILSLFMLEFYSEFYTSEFYEDMLKIYLAGHLPCGWSGKYPKGKFIVY